MTHQYVGAYYVPHGWYMEYDPQFQYDPLSTVFYKNAWYILKQPAPVGTEPTNSQYWTQYNLVPGQINEIETDIENIKGNVSDVQEKVNSIPYTNFKTDKFVFLGDSFATLLQGNTTTLFELIANNLSIPENNYTIAAIGGLGFSTSATRPATPWFEDWIKSNLSTFNECDHLIIFLGNNDFYHSATSTENGIKAFMQMLTKYKVPNIIVLNCCYTANNSYTIRQIYDCQQAYCSTFATYGITVHTNLRYVMYGPSTNYDGQHPNMNGLTKLSALCTEKLKGGDTYFYTYNDFGPTLPPNMTGTTTLGNYVFPNDSLNGSFDLTVTQNIVSGQSASFNIPISTAMFSDYYNGVTYAQINGNNIPVFIRAHQNKINFSFIAPVTASSFTIKGTVSIPPTI